MQSWAQNQFCLTLSLMVNAHYTGECYHSQIHSGGNSELISLAAVGDGQLCFLEGEGWTPGAQELNQSSHHS